MSRRLAGQGRGKKDLSNDVVRYQSVSVQFLKEIWDGVLEGDGASGVELFVLKKSSGDFKKATTVKKIKHLKSGGKIKCEVPFVGQRDIPVSSLESKPRADWTIQDVCEYVILPPCQRTNCFYLDLMDPSSVGKTYQGAFVSQARKSKFSHLVDALVEHYDGKDLSQQFVWLDIFCANQPKLTSKDDGLSPEVKQKRWEQLTFGLHDAIQHFDDRLLLFNSWLNPYPLSRAWCAWEIYGTIKCEKNIDLLFAPGAVEHFVETVKTDFDSIMRNLADLDLKKAECRSQKDLEMIRSAVNKSVGFAKLNNSITELLRKWLVVTARNAVQRQQQKTKKKGGRLMRKSGIEQKLDLALLLNQFGLFYQDQGMNDEAEPMYREALAIDKEIFGTGHPNVARDLNNLASLVDDQGKYVEAEPLYRESLAIRKKVYGDEHPDVAASLNNLASLLKSQGKYDEAEPLYRETLAILKKVHGDEHPNIASCLNNLALLLQSQGKHVEAEPLYRESLAIRKKVYGDEHPAVATCLNNLAGLLREQGKYDEAEPLYREALAIDKKVYGDEHPEVATDLNNLAQLLIEQQRLEEAERLCIDGLDIRRKLLGERHARTAQSLNTFGNLRRCQKRYVDADTQYGIALKLRQDLLGEEHPDVAETLYELALLYKVRGQTPEAEEVGSRAYKIIRQKFGTKHPKAIKYLECWK